MLDLFDYLDQTLTASGTDPDAVAARAVAAQRSIAEQLHAEDLAAEFFGRLPDPVALAAEWDFDLWGRPKQIVPPGDDWSELVWMAGRGFGKTRCICEWAIEKARSLPGSRGVIVARTAADARDILIDGESGILAISRPDFMPVYEPSKRKITWPNGSSAVIRSAEKIDSTRGLQGHWGCGDELAAWKLSASEENPDAYENMRLGIRLVYTHKDGRTVQPQMVFATTPRPNVRMREIVKRATDPTSGLRIVTGSTYENKNNLARAFFGTVISKYEGTRVGRQELSGELLLDALGRVYLEEWFTNQNRYEQENNAVVVGRYIAVDGAMKDKESNDYSAIVVVELLTDYRVRVVEAWRDRLRLPALLRQLETMIRTYSADGMLRGIVIEDKASGTGAIQTLETTPEIAPLLVAFQPEGDKLYRAQQGAVWAERNMVLLPQPGNGGRDFHDFCVELFEFNGDDGTLHDDFVDAFSMILIYLEHYIAQGWLARRNRTRTHA